jgi:ABC-type multidrug transport system ATPase subunit
VNSAVLRAESIGHRFGQRQVLKAATLHAFAQRITVLLGRNGCGKSTLLRIIAGQLRPDYGAIHFAGDVHERPRLARLARAGLFFIPERGLLSPFLPLAQHLALANAARERVESVTGALGLTALLQSYGKQLSAGERRRADLALAVLRAPTCLLADEPFQGIGPLDVERIAGQLQALRARGCAIVITGHEIGPLFDQADEIVWMTAGTTHLLGPVASARAHDQFVREYLGSHRLPGP